MIRTPKILKLPNFRKLYIAGITSELGSFVTETVLMLFVFKLSGQNKAYLGILRAVFLVFLTLGGILGGPIGNKYNRKKILIFCEIARIPLLVLLFFFQNIPMVIACNAVIAFFTGIFRPSRQAMINEIVPQDNIKKANGLFGSTVAILHLVGPLLGATLFGLLNGINLILLGDLLTYALGLWLLSQMIYSDEREVHTQQEGLFLEIKEGFKYLGKRKDLLAINLNAFCAGLAIGILIPLLVPFTIEILGKSERHYGIIMAFFGLGGIVGSWSAEKVSHYLPHGKVPLLTIIIETLIFIAFVLNRNFPLSFLILFFWGYLFFFRITTKINFISDSVETHFLTRVHSLLEMSFIIPNISGGLLIAILGEKYQTMELLLAAAVLFFLSINLRLPLKHMRLLWKTEPGKVERVVQV
ncbi:MAG: MFS transporter [Bdellovibrionota bacterium]|nr:MFS transporter [Bdellovibrionota bacterium]